MSKELCQICGIGKQEITCDECGEVVCGECIYEKEELDVCGECLGD